MVSFRHQVKCLQVLLDTYIINKCLEMDFVALCTEVSHHSLHVTGPNTKRTQCVSCSPLLSSATHVYVIHTHDAEAA